MFRNNIQSGSRRETLKVLDLSPRNYVTARFSVRLRSYANTYQHAYIELRPVPVYTMFRSQGEPSNLIFERNNLFARPRFREKFSSRNFRIGIPSLAGVFPFPLASRAFSSLGSSITRKGREETCIGYDELYLKESSLL